MQLDRTVKSGICPKVMSVHSEINRLSLIIISLASLQKSVKYPHLAWRCVCVHVCMYVYEVLEATLQRCTPVENMWLFSTPEQCSLTEHVSQP